ncbi:MAG: DUF4250 domain-containing protein [Blautia sp.]|nr:DUF4250 domain-containing protein [Blautia sp.]
MLPKDPVMLLSYVNTQLRDHYKDLESFCGDQDINEEELRAKLRMIDYEYDPETNQFI